MLRWYVLLNSGFAIWIFVDGLRRKANATLWAIGTLIFGSYIFPVYLMARKPIKSGQEREDERQERRDGAAALRWRLLKGCIFPLGIIFWTLLIIGASIWKDTSPLVKAREEDFAYKLAILDAKGDIRLGQDDDRLLRFRSLLDQLSENYAEDRQQIANISALVYKRIKARGLRRDASLLKIMEDLNRLGYYGQLKHQSYAERAFSYVRLRYMGQSHNQAIEGLQLMVRGY